MGTTNVFLTLSEAGFDKGDATFENNQLSGVKWGSTVVRGSDKLAVAGSIEVLEYGFGLSQKGSEEGGRPRSVEAVTRTPLKIKKWADSRTPLLFYYCASGKYIKEATLKVFGESFEHPYLTYDMSYVHISGFNPSGGEDLSAEEIELTFGQMKVIFTTPAGKKVERAWSWLMEMGQEAGKV